MGKYRRLGWALLISLLGHLVLWRHLPSPETVRPVARFEVELTAPSAPEPTPAVEAKPVEEISEADSHQPPAEPESTPVAEPEPDDGDPDRSEPVVPTPAPLDLSRPPGWDEIVREVTVQDSRLAFLPELGRRLEAREAEVRRSRLVQRRSAATYGVADDDYVRSGPLGQELKRDGGCVRLVEDRDVEEGQRWWASTCTETRENPFTLPAVEYDALGRVVAD